MLSGATLVPNVVLLLLGVGAFLLVAYLVAVLTDRNPLPFPDRDYQVFSAASNPGLIALEELMQHFGHRPRFRIDSEQVDRTVFSNGTIINAPQPHMLAQLGDPAAALGFVVTDPERAAREAAELLRRHGCSGEVVLGAEPGLPITFVRTDALKNSALVFRKHVLQMGQKPPVWTPRRPIAAA